MNRSLTQKISLKRITNTEGYVSSNVMYEIPSNVTELVVGVPQWSTPNNSEGFRKIDNSTFKWKNNGNNKPSLQLTIPANPPMKGPPGKKMADVGEWAILEAPNLFVKWRSRGNSAEMRRQLCVENTGIASRDNSLVYLGEYQEHTHQSAGQKFRLIVPDAASLRESPEDIFDALAHAADFLQVSGRGNEVMAIAAPTEPVNWGPGGINAGGDAFWARDDSRLDIANNTWVHEYIHTCQKFSTGPSMRWLIEAQAVYFAAFLTYQRDMISTEECYAALNASRYTSDKLGKPTEWSSHRVPYRKGCRVIHWIAHQIRSHTQKSMLDLLDKLNTVSDGSITDISTRSPNDEELDDSITFDDFTEIINEILGNANQSLMRSIRTELDEAVFDSGVTPEKPPKSEIKQRKSISPDPDTISEVEEMFEKQTDVSLETNADSSEQRDSSLTDVDDMFDNKNDNQATDKNSHNENSNETGITDVDDMYY